MLNFKENEKNLFSDIFRKCSGEINVNFGLGNEFGGVNYIFNEINKDQFYKIINILEEKSQKEKVNYSSIGYIDKDLIDLEILEVLNIIHGESFFEFTVLLKNGEFKFLQGCFLDEECPDFKTNHYVKIENTKYYPA